MIKKTSTKKLSDEKESINRLPKPSLKGLFIFLSLVLITLSGCSPSTDQTTGNRDLYFNMWAEGGTGIMSCSGEWIVGPIDREQGRVNGPMTDDLAPFVIIEDWYYTYINQNGEFPFTEKYEVAMPFSEGLAAVMVDGVWGFIDTNGTFVIQPQFESSMIGRFNNGLANVVYEVDDTGYPLSWIYINTKGEKVLGPYLSAESFSNGYAEVSGVKAGEGSKSGFIDTNGDFVLEFTQGIDTYGPAGAYGDGLFPVIDIGKQYKEGTCSIGFMNKDGDWVIEPQFCRVDAFSNGLAPVSKSDDPNFPPFGYINTSGQMVIEQKYQFATPFFGGCARVIWDDINSFGLIDPEGNIIYAYSTAMQ